MEYTLPSNECSKGNSSAENEALRVFPHVNMARWQEIEQAEREKRHEIVLNGAEISERIEKNGVDDCLFKLEYLNFLEISKTCLKSIPENIGELSNLTNLVLFHNKIQDVPSSIQKLKKLKLLDISNNCIESFPPEVNELTALQSLNLCGNQLTDFPEIGGMVMLHVLDLSQNKLEALPSGIPSSELVHLADVRAAGNELKELPDELSELAALKILDVSENKLTHIPADISECMKLKEFTFGGNKLKDRRLAKMGQQCTTKSVLDYLRGVLEKERQKDGKGKGGKKGKGKRKKEKSMSEVEDLSSNMMRVLHFNDEDDAGGFVIKTEPGVLNVRPYIVACIVRHIDFCKTKNMYKRFISLQTRLHESVCNKRQAATIATHDLAAIKMPLSYESRPPATMMVRPLFKMKEVSAQRMVSKLRQEAEELRKEKKRNTISGIHKYLDLLKGKTEYPCLVDSSGVIISFPPITNCDSSKISRETTDILIEVTSTINFDTCKKVMQELLQCMLEMGLGNAEASATTGAAALLPEDDDEGAAGGDLEEGEQEVQLTTDQCLVVEQMKVTDEEGSLRVVYPSRVDLVSNAFRVIR